MFMMERRVRQKSHARCGRGEKLEITSKAYLSVLFQEDKKLNDESYKNKNDRILACYETSEGNVYVIEESYENTITILFANEY